MIRHSGSICARSSGSIGGRLALYSGYSSWRKFFPGASSTTATRSGRARRSCFCTVLTTP